MSIEKLTISKTGHKKGHISYSDGSKVMTLNADYDLGRYSLCRSERTPQGAVMASYEALKERIDAESAYTKLLEGQGLDFCPLMFRRQIESMDFGETICRIINRETLELENEY